MNIFFYILTIDTLYVGCIALFFIFLTFTQEVHTIKADLLGNYCICGYHNTGRHLIEEAFTDRNLLLLLAVPYFFPISEKANHNNYPSLKDVVLTFP